MKMLSKTLIPTVSIISIATISLTSCGTTSADGYVAVPTDFLDINGTTLNGFKDEYTPIKNYSKITVPKNIETVKLIYGYHKFAYDCIKKIDFESNSNWKTIQEIANLNNLEILVLPSKLASAKEHMILKCPKLTTIDISNVENIDCLTNIEWVEFDETEHRKGTLIIKHTQLDKVQSIKNLNPDLVNFEVKEI